MSVAISKTRTYRKWICAKWRCRHDKHYLQTGVTFSSAWLDYKVFLDDMGECPEGMQLDRIKNERGYEPGNCRWVTRNEQQLNKTNSRRLIFNGITRNLKDWSVETGIHYATLIHRINVGWPIEYALTSKPRFGNRRPA